MTEILKVIKIILINSNINIKDAMILLIQVITVTENLKIHLIAKTKIIYIINKTNKVIRINN